MNYSDYAKLRLVRGGGIATVVIDNPPVNVLDAPLMGELRHLLSSLAQDDEIKVVVFESGNADFFIAHVDKTLIDDPHAFDAIARETPAGLNVFQALGELVRSLPQVTIVKLVGLARGGGAEFIAACDMAFGAIGRAGLGQVEALMGIVPSGGAMQYLSDRMSRGRTLEVVLGAELFSAEDAAAYGWINRALPADELDGFVDGLARNIAALPDGVIQAAKRVLPPRPDGWFCARGKGMGQTLCESLRRALNPWRVGAERTDSRGREELGGHSARHQALGCAGRCSGLADQAIG